MNPEPETSCPRSEVRQHGIGPFDADHARELFACGTAHTRDAAERGQQGLAPPGADPADFVQLRSQIARLALLPMERHREAVRLIPDALDQEERGALGCQSNRILAIAREEQLLLLGDPDPDERSEPELLESLVGRRELALAAIDQQEIRKRPARLEKLAVATEDDFVHRGEVVQEPGVGARRSALGRSWSE